MEDLIAAEDGRGRLDQSAQLAVAAPLRVVDEELTRTIFSRDAEELLAPVVELIGYCSLVLGVLVGGINVQFASLFLLVAIAYGLLLSFWAIVLEELSFRRYGKPRDLLWMFLFAVLETLGYRQMTVWFRLKAFWSYARGSHAWGVMTREGFAVAPTAADPDR